MKATVRGECTALIEVLGVSAKGSSVKGFGFILSDCAVPAFIGLGVSLIEGLRQAEPRWT